MVASAEQVGGKNGFEFLRWNIRLMAMKVKWN